MSNVIPLKKNNLEEDLKYNRFLKNFPEFNLGSFILMIACVFLMIISTFTIIPSGIFNSQILYDPAGYVLDLEAIALNLHTHLYSPQIPIAIFAGALLGYRLGATSMSLYVILGLAGVPIFASGGGIGYVTKPVFGFIIGYIIAAFIVGFILKKKTNSLTIILSSLAAVLAVHLIGDIYLTINMFINGYSFSMIKEWLYGLSLCNIPYDILFAVILCAIARPIRGLLWLMLE